MSPAAQLTARIREAVSHHGARLFNCHVGTFWAGRGEKITSAKTVTLSPGDVVIRRGYPVVMGVKGQSDLNGWVSVVVTPEMVGQTVAIRCDVEVKAGKDRPTPEQLAYIAAVIKNGGRAGIARTAAEAISICKGQAGE